MIEPKPMITMEQFKATHPKTLFCKTHGEFEIEVLTIGKTEIPRLTCPECANEYSTWKEEQDKIEKKRKDREMDQKIFENKLLNAGVSIRHFDKTFDNYIADTEEKQFALKSMRYFAQVVLDGGCKNIILCGSVGTGKTHLCQASIRWLLEQNNKQDIRIATITEIIRYYRGSWSKDSEYTEQEAVDRLSSCDLLIIDEMGIQNGTENELNIIFEIINNRYENKKPTAIISNLQKNELIELLGTRIIDRLKEDGCRVLGMAWDSYRETNKGEF